MHVACQRLAWRAENGLTTCKQSTYVVLPHGVTGPACDKTPHLIWMPNANPDTSTSYVEVASPGDRCVCATYLRKPDPSEPRPLRTSQFLATLRRSESIAVSTVDQPWGSMYRSAIESILLLTILAFGAGDDRAARGQTGRNDPRGAPQTGWRRSGPADRPAETPYPGASEGVGPNGQTAFPEVAEVPHVRLQGSLLLVDDCHMLPRAIEYQGEPLAFLKNLGFNTVWLPNPPSSEILREARQLRLWLVCPPPPVAFDQTGARASSRGVIGPEYDRVLAWDLGRGLHGREISDIGRLAKLLRAADQPGRRPLICGPQTDLRAFSRQVDLLLLGRSPLLGSLELTDYGKWVRTRPWLASPGKATWTTVQTQPAGSLLGQWRVLGKGKLPPLSISSEQIGLVAYTAVTSGGRGLLFESLSPLDANDPETRYRAATLELLNLELSLAEPWFAAGDFVSTVEGRDPVQGRDPEAVGVVLRTDKSQLLVPMWTAPGGQFVCGQSAGNGISFVVPGVPNEYRAFQLQPGGLPPVALAVRVNGGTRITLDEFGLTALVVLTAERLWVANLAGAAKKVGRRAAELRRQLAEARLLAVGQVLAEMSEGVLSQFNSDGPGGRSSSDHLNEARKGLQSCDGCLARGDYATAWLLGERAMRPVRLMERELWDAAISRVESPVTTPASVSFWTLPMHWELLRRIGTSRPGPNRLAGGEFEDRDTWVGAGWDYRLYSLAGIFAEADLSPAAARTGRLGLRILAYPSDIEEPVSLVETSPARITTPPVAVEAHTLMVIHGWVNVPTPITGSVDGLMIIDSFGQEPLAQRIGQTDGWQEFTLYRVAPQSGHLTVTFALTGLGEARIDDVTVESVDPGVPWASRPGQVRPPTARVGSLSRPQ